MITVGLAGAGWAASEFHAPAYADDPRAEITAVADLDETRGRELSEQYSIPHVYASAADMISDRNLDVVSICTPPHTHEEVFSEAVRNGCAVFCEKPMTTTLESARRMRALAEEHDTITQVGYVQKYYENYRRALTLVRSGLLGEVTHVTSLFYGPSPPSGWYVDPDRSGGGVVSDRLPHLLDFYLELLGERLAVERSTLRSRSHHDVEDVADIDLADDDVTLSMSIGWAVEGSFSKQVVLGTHGWLEFDNVFLDGTIHGRDIHFKYGRTPTIDLKRGRLFLARSDDAQSARITDFIDHIERQDRRTAAPVERGLEITSIVEEIYDLGGVA